MDGAREAIVQRGRETCDRVQVFEYPSCGAAESEKEWNGWVEAGEVGDGAGGREIAGGGATGVDGKQSGESGRWFEAGRERGREEGRTTEREAQSAARKSDEERFKRQLGKLVADFAIERDRFLQLVEREVVQLALAVAARVLRREAQMDPLLLTGAVRVALGQLAGTTEVQLTVPTAQVELWREAIDLIPNLAVKPSVVAGDSMRIGDCMIRSKVGTVDLGVRSQLGEIERGFFDRAGIGVADGAIVGGEFAVRSEAKA
jgi:flagellar assembly protein FliH